MVKIKKTGFSFRGSLTPINKRRVDKIVQHHMAHKSWNINDVHNYHKNSNGWAGIGYNYWIAFDGTIYEGRGMNVGAHVGGHNSHTIGIGYQGDFSSQKMTDAQLKSGIELNKWLIGKFPNVGKNDIIGHSDLASTACPGRNFRMSELKKGVKGELSSPSWTKVSGSWTGQTLGNGEYGKPIRELQTKLYENKPRYLKKGDIDGYFGSTTEKAVREYQKDNGLDIDGLAGKQVYKSLKEGLTVSEYNKLKKEIDSLKKELAKKLNKPIEGEVSSVHEENWEWGHEEGITKQSNPLAYVRYEQVISLLKNLHDEIKPTYQKPGSSHEEAWNKMVELDLITDINPHHPVKRAQLATILDRAGVLDKEVEICLDGKEVAKSIYKDEE